MGYLVYLGYLSSLGYWVIRVTKVIRGRVIRDY